MVSDSRNVKVIIVALYNFDHCNVQRMDEMLLAKFAGFDLLFRDFFACVVVVVLPKIGKR